MNKIKLIIESMKKKHKVLGLVSMMNPVDLMKSLISGLDLLPKEAAKIVYDLKKKTEGMIGAGIESNKAFPVPSSMKGPPKEDDEEEFEEAVGNATGMRSGPEDDGKGKFPPPPRAEPDSFPYDQVFVNYMNNPKRKRPITSGKEKGKERNPLDIDLRVGQPGGDGPGGQGIYQKSRHSRDNDMPGGGKGWTKQGRPGWSSSPKGKEFDVPPKLIKKADPVETGPKNAGDIENGSLFMNDPNVAQTIWVPGRQNVRSAPYRGPRRR